MQITVSTFLKLSVQQLHELKDLQFWDHEEELDEDFSLLTEHDFIKLCDLLTNCQQLSRLELCDNNIGNLHLSRIVKLANSISSCCKLKTLDLSNNNLQVLALEAWTTLLHSLAKALSLDTLILNSNQLGTLKTELLDVIFDNLVPTKLTRLDLAWNEIGNNNALEIFISKIVKYPRLISLNLSNNQLFNYPQQIIKLFANLHLIKELKLSNNNLGLIKIDLDLETTVTHNLEIIDVSSNQLGTSSEFFVFIMRQATTVKELDLSSNQLHLLGDQLKFNSYQYLEILKLADNNFAMLQQNFIQLITILEECNNLTEIDLANTNLNSLPTASLNHLFDVLLDKQNLLVLNIAANNFGSTAGIPKLENLLKQNKLTKLDISDNSLGSLASDDWQHLVAGLACSYNLTALNMASNNLQQNSESIISLTQALQNCSSLQKLNLGDNNFTAATTGALQELFAGLAALPRLIKLDLSDSLADYLQTAENIDVLFNFIQTTTSLTTLTLEQGISCELEQQIKETLTNKPYLKLKLR